MSDLTQLPHLLKLLDDESREIRSQVLSELDAFGPTLISSLAGLDEPISEDQQALIEELIDAHRRGLLKQTWGSWLKEEHELDQLEMALSMIAEFQNGRRYPVKLSDLLDELADEYNAGHENRDIFSLARFLFREKGMVGNQKDYFSPLNSNLVYVIEEKKGLPISLTQIYMLVGKRIGLRIEGCNFPSHFLARAWSGEKAFFVDCFNGGQIIEAETLEEQLPDNYGGIRMIIKNPAGPRMMMKRVLANLQAAYEKAGERANALFMEELMLDTGLGEDER